MKSNIFWNGFLIVLLVCISGFVYKTMVLPKPYKKVLKLGNDTLDFKNYQGKVVVLNFWASWSKASRIENKGLHRLYEEFRINPKVIFVSVSLDTDSSAWKTAIDEDELIWKEHYCDFKKYDSPMAKNYQIVTLPKFLVYDVKGKQIGSFVNTYKLDSLINSAIR